MECLPPSLPTDLVDVEGGRVAAAAPRHLQRVARGARAKLQEVAHGAAPVLARDDVQKVHLLQRGEGRAGGGGVTSDQPLLKPHLG